MAGSAFFAVIRDVSKLVAAAADDVAAQSTKLMAAADDIAGMTAKAAAKTAGVAGDDLAVGAGQVNGISASRELAAVYAIAKGSAFNKLWLAVVLLILSEFVPVAITVALCLGGLYLAFEGAEGLFHRGDEDEGADSLTEAEKVKAAIRTDLILSLEILVIALAEVANSSLLNKVLVLSAVGVLMTVGVYGLIALLVRLDDMGIALLRSPRPWLQSVGRKFIVGAPKILSLLGPIGMIAMFAVAGGIFMHLGHIELSPWPLAFAADIGVGVAVGGLLVLLHGLVHKIAHKK